MNNGKYLLLLHLTVLIWGFTGLIGEIVSLDYLQIVWYRMGIASLSLFLILGVYKGKKLIFIPWKYVLRYLGVGVIIMFHWLFFFNAIKTTGVKVAIICMATSAFFTAILEVLILRRKLQNYKFIVGLLSFTGIYIINQTKDANLTGILMGIFSAFLAALFSVINAKFVAKPDQNAASMTLYELFGGFLFVTLILGFQQRFTPDFFEVSGSDFAWLIVLGTICTSVAFMVSVWLMKFLSPFTVALAVNLEPVYTILLVMVMELITLGRIQPLEGSFFIGAVIILIAVFSDSIISQRKKLSA